MNLDNALTLALKLRRVMRDPVLRDELLGQLLVRGTAGAKELLDKRRDQLPPELYRELYELLHGHPPPATPPPGTGIAKG